MPLLGKLFAAWMRRGVYTRIFIPLLFLIVTVATVRYHLLIAAETGSTEARYQAGARQLGTYLVASVKDRHSRASIETTLASAMLLNGDIAAIRWQARDQQLEVRSSVRHRADYPAWFGRLTGLQTVGADFPVRLDDGTEGVLSLSSNPTLQTSRLWDVMAGQIGISALNVLVLYGFLILLLNANRGMLRRLEQATYRFRHGDYGIRMKISGTMEGRALARTFNDMAGEVQALVTSLQSSQKKLGDQLEQTVNIQSALQQMSWQTYHDVLTGLPNRAALTTRFEQDLFLAKERGRLHAICLVDLDHFQRINARVGADACDTLLKQVAERLHGFAHQSHYVARLGADEFVVLLSGVDDSEAVARIAAQLLAELSRPYECERQPLLMSASIGIAIYTGGETGSDTLLRQADQALYQAKLTGRNKFHLFDADLDEQVRTHHNQRTEIRQALLDGQLRLYYQPKVDMRAGVVVGMEALLRWQHPQRGTVGPIQFLPMIEHTDLIIDIGEWALREALQQMQRWRGAGHDWVISVNIAARHFQQPDFVARLRQILADFPDVPASMLELEILESAALYDIEHVRHVMTACQAFGISFALDDFGTGYSSMSYLKRLPANVLKIDQSFVRDMLDDQDDLHLVSAVIGLARSFHLTVIAEGVETVEHGTRLMQLGCDLAQGYGIARPMPADTVENWALAFVPAPAWRAAANALGQAA